MRVSYLLANKKAVVCEYSNNTEIDEHLLKAVALTPYDQLVEKCIELTKSDENRHALEQSGFECIQSLNEGKFLEKLLEERKSAPKPAFIEITSSASSHPLKINIGSGKDFRADYLNLDYTSYWKPDVVVDLSEPDLLGQAFSTERFGNITLNTNTFDLIIANDVLEHIPDLVTAMTNCLGLLREGGEFHIAVPYDLSHGAWQDPTHVRAFNEKSWLYYTDWFWYLGWKESRFDLINLQYNLSPLGVKFQQDGHDIDTIIRQPRAIDSMSVVLRKRHLSNEERQFVVQVTTPKH